MSDKDKPDPPNPATAGILKELESKKLEIIFSNYASVTAAAEEFVFRFCHRDINKPEELAHEIVRVYLSPNHAKRFALALVRTIKGLEELFGEIKTEIRPTVEGEGKLEEIRKARKPHGNVD